MMPDEIAKLRNRGLHSRYRELGHIEPSGYLRNIIIGVIDAEYKSGEKCLSFGISLIEPCEVFKDHRFIHYPKGKYITEEEISFAIRDDLVSAGFHVAGDKVHKKLFLVSYWSEAELSQMDKFWEFAKIHFVAPKIMNLTFEINSRLSVVIFDIYHLFSDIKAKSRKLDDIAKAYGLEGKKSLEGLDEKSEDYWKKNMDEFLLKHKDLFEEYLYKDLEITGKLIMLHRKKVFEETSLGGNTGIDIFDASTNGSIAIKHFKQKYIPEGEGYSNWDKTLREFILRCSHGAVMAALRPGTYENVSESDATGYYTYAGINCGIMPRTEEDIKKTYSFEKFLVGYDGWCEVDFEFPKIYKGRKVYPSLPVIEYHPGTKKKSVILFPRTGTSFCTLVEIKTAMELGAKIDFIRGAYFNTGTDSWSRFCQEQKELREEAKRKRDKIGEAIHKSMPNAATGKLLQSKGGYDLEKAKKACKILGCSLQTYFRDGLPGGEIYSEEIKKEMDNAGLRSLKCVAEPKIGFSFCPEWWSLILGRARAGMWYVVNKYGINPIHISTDSFHDIVKIEGEIETPAGMFVFKEEMSGKLTVDRTKVYVHDTGKFDEKGNLIIKAAHHAIHTVKEEAIKLILGRTEKPVSYKKHKRDTLRDAILLDEPLGSEKDIDMVYKPGYDYKMKILPNGETEPWESIEEYFTFIKGKNQG